MRYSLKAGKFTFSYLDVGPRNTPAVVFVHGNSQSAEFFEPLLTGNRLSSLRLVAVDLPGHGHSERLPGYRFEDFKHCLERLVDYLQLESYFMVGNSFGGHVIVQALDRLSPSGLVLCGAPPLSKPLPANAFHPRVSLGGLYLEKVNETQLAELRRDLGFGPQDSYFSKAYAETDPHFRSSLNQIVVEQDLSDEIQLLSCYHGHVTLACGETDPIINAEYVAGVADEISAAFCTLPGDHSFLRNRPTTSIDFLLREVEHALLSTRTSPLPKVGYIDESYRAH